MLSEKKVLSKVAHPFLVELKSTFQDSFFLYLVLEYVQGGELYHLLTRTGYIEPYDARIYACEMVSALVYLHANNIVFRDLKPENVLITPAGHVKLTDFGFAKVLGQGERTFTLCGTPEYLAPEVITSTGHSFECDWWALGVLLFEMLAGCSPFSGDTPFQLYEHILTSEVSYPSHLDLTTRSLIGSLLIKDPSMRATESSIKTHPYFSTVDWEDVRDLKLQPDFRPRVRNPMDTRNFEKYAEEDQALDERKPTDAGVFREF